MAAHLDRHAAGDRDVVDTIGLNVSERKRARVIFL